MSALRKLLVTTCVAALAWAAPVRAAFADAPAPGTQRSLVGKLTYRALPKGQSVEAYHGVTFFLTLDDGREESLYATKEVSANALYAFNGKAVEVRGTWIAPRIPGASEPAPLDPFGNVIPRSGRWAVQQVKAATSSTKTLVGKLAYRPLPRNQSVEAYHGVTFFLTLDDGTEESLYATKEVSANALYAFNGKRIEVRATWIPPAPPGPGEAAPLDPFGNVIPRAGRWAVQQVKTP